MKNTWVIIIVIAVVVLGGYFLLKNQATSPTPAETTNTTQAMEQTIVLAEQNASGESGSALLVEQNGKVVVTLTLTGSPADVSQPAHIHVGSCPDVGEVAYPLTNVVNGASVTTLDVTLDQLASEQPLGINVHKSVTESGVYTSCGDLTL